MKNKGLVVFLFVFAVRVFADTKCSSENQQKALQSLLAPIVQRVTDTKQFAKDLGLPDDESGLTETQKTQRRDQIRAAQSLVMTRATQLVFGYQLELHAISRTMVEIGRTDKNFYTAAGGGGSTSAIDLPGISQLLAVAIERGAITEQQDSTALTLTISPWAIIGVQSQDKPGELPFLKRIGGALTYLADASAPSPNQPSAQQLLSVLSSDKLAKYAARFRAIGDREISADDFCDPALDPEIGVLNKLVEPKLNLLVNGSIHDARNQLSAGNTVATESFAAPTARADLHAFDVDSLARGETPVTFGVNQVQELSRAGAVRKFIEGGISAQVLSPVETVVGLLRENRGQVISAVQQDVDKRPQLTLAYTGHNQANAMDYSSVALLYDQAMADVHIVVNAGAGLFHQSNSLNKGDRLRHLDGALSLQGSMLSPLTQGSDDSRLTYSVTGRYERSRISNADIAVLQFSTRIPAAGGVKIPLSFTYANRTEFIKEKEIRGNFGLSFDLDTVMALVHSIKTPH